MKTLEQLLSEEESKKVRKMLDDSAEGKRFIFASLNSGEDFDADGSLRTLESILDSGIDSELLKGYLNDTI